MGLQFVQRDQGGVLGWISRVSEQNDIEHRLIKPYHPWTNGQAEPMVRAIKKVTVRSFHYTSINKLRRLSVTGRVPITSPSSWKPCASRCSMKT